ncbi:MAG: hypothetical protein IPI87_10830 [Betaproteobacteria bacterium]|nr:hypothetical protein [Betaproteobacteria bacterium]
MAPFEQVVAQDPVLRKAAAERALERVDVVDPLSDEGALAEDVLVDVRDGARVRIDAGVAGMQARVPRAAGPGQARAHAGLQDCVPFGHALASVCPGCSRPGKPPLPPCGGAEARAVQRMRHRSNHLPRRIPRQLRVGVQRDHVLHVREHPRVAHDEREALACAAAQERVQVAELAALALVAHPQALLRIPPARAMKEEEGIADRTVLGRERRMTVLPVECLD